ncbi:hypothetical protein BDK51DRAFT_31251 [Blyttiomyces helicus]|uniref:Uncharacterized protein n=1 Tax=Blyttiomyces helicus TaxID=388810 RepID=A0A4P9WS68_9FUNG|nr:hypothetical protein BDK51DRAFT_31251 [Blyttiomyces helicus]|eukprot:RKO93826.1 hypothetical protein BDK51DRAFT_31251 [Blyttiomyces helicus]
MCAPQWKKAIARPPVSWAFPNGWIEAKGNGDCQLLVTQDQYGAHPDSTSLMLIFAVIMWDILSLFLPLIRGQKSPWQRERDLNPTAYGTHPMSFLNIKQANIKFNAIHRDSSGGLCDSHRSPAQFGHPLLDTLPHLAALAPILLLSLKEPLSITKHHTK